MTNNDNLNWPIFNVFSKPSDRNMIILNENRITTSINVKEEELIENSFNNGFLVSNNIDSMKDVMVSAYPLVDKCIIIDNNEFLKPLILNDNINTSKSNILFNEIISNNSDISFMCIIVIGITIGIYLLYKLLSFDEEFPRGLKCFRSDDTERLIKEISGPVYTKPSRWASGGYDCEHCCCGYDCRCCCKHNDIEIIEFEGKHSRTPGTPEEEALRAGDIAKAEAQRKAEIALKKAELEKKEADAKASLLEWRKKAQEAQAAKKAAGEAASVKKADVPLAWGLYFQDGASPSFEGIVDLHNRIMFYLVFILFGVTWVMVSIMRNFNKNENKLVYRYLNHGTLIELIWTVGPALVLVAIAFPSFKLLYLMDNKLCPLFVFTNKKNSKICKNL